MFLRLSQIRFVRVGKWNKSYDGVRLFESNVLFTVLFHASEPSLIPLSSPPLLLLPEEDCSLAEKIYEETQFLGRFIRWNWFDSVCTLVEIINFLFMKMFLYNFCWEQYSLSSNFQFWKNYCTHIIYLWYIQDILIHTRWFKRVVRR